MYSLLIFGGIQQFEQDMENGIQGLQVNPEGMLYGLYSLF